MTFDESHAKITEQMCGRTVAHVTRKGLVLQIHTSCGHTIRLQADDKGHIHYRGTDVTIVVPLPTGMELLPGLLSVGG